MRKAIYNKQLSKSFQWQHAKNLILHDGRNTFMKT